MAPLCSLASYPPPDVGVTHTFVYLFFLNVPCSLDAHCVCVFIHPSLSVAIGLSLLGAFPFPAIVGNRRPSTNIFQTPTRERPLSFAFSFSSFSVAPNPQEPHRVLIACPWLTFGLEIFLGWRSFSAVRVGTLKSCREATHERC